LTLWRSLGALVAIAPLLSAAGSADWKTYVNVRYGYSVCYPANLLKAQPEADNSDGRAFTGPGGARLLVFGSNNVLQSSLADEAGAQARNYLGKRGKITYRAAKANWIVISGTDGGAMEFYTKTFRRRDQFLAFHLEYPRAAAAAFKPVIERLNRCFAVLEPAY
jgi:hypothetical protein